MKKIFKILSVFVLVLLIFLNFNLVSADPPKSVQNNNASTSATADAEPDTSLSGILGKGSSWFNKSKSAGNADIGGIFSNILGTTNSGGLVTGIFQVGNVIFVIITILLGLKYMFSSIGGKADVKESMIPLAIGAIFFYLPQTIFEFFNSIFNGFSSASSVDSVTGPIFSTVSTIANVAAIIAIVAVGLKYMLTNSEERAEVKQRLVPLVIGIGFVYASSKVLLFFVGIGQGIL